MLSFTPRCVRLEPNGLSDTHPDEPVSLLLGEGDYFQGTELREPRGEQDGAPGLIRSQGGSNGG